MLLGNSKGEIEMKEKPEIHEGKIVSVSENKITSTCVEGDEHHHTLAKGAKVTIDGKESKLTNLKVGMPVRVTTCADDDSKTSCVSAGKKTSAAKA
jgi:uncharacterized Zn finger protein